MSVATRARPSRSAERRNERPPWRWRSVLLAVLATLFVVSAAGLWFLSTWFAPLSLGSGPSFVRTQGGEVQSVPAVEPSSGRPFIAHEVAYRDGAWLETGFTVVNGGPFPVTVDGVAVDGGSVIRPVSVSVNDPSTSAFEAGGPTLLGAFEPFTLRADEARFVVVRYRFAGCSLDQPEEEMRKVAERVTFGIEVAGITVHRAESLPLPFSLRVTGNDGCP